MRIVLQCDAQCTTMYLNNSFLNLRVRALWSSVSLFKEVYSNLFCEKKNLHLPRYCSDEKNCLGRAYRRDCTCPMGAVHTKVFH